MSCHVRLPISNSNYSHQVLLNFAQCRLVNTKLLTVLSTKLEVLKNKPNKMAYFQTLFWYFSWVTPDSVQFYRVLLELILFLTTNTEIAHFFSRRQR